MKKIAYYETGNTVTKVEVINGKLKICRIKTLKTKGSDIDARGKVLDLEGISRGTIYHSLD